MTEPLKVTSIEEITKRTKEVFEAEAIEPELVKLPETGIVVRLRRVNVMDDPVAGGLPLALVASAIGAKAETEEVTPDRMKEISVGMLFMRQTVVENCVEPRVGFDVAGRVCFLNGSGHAIARVHKKDFKYMWAYITGQEARSALESFRDAEDGRAAAAGPDSKELRVPPKPRVEHQESQLSAGV